MSETEFSQTPEGHPGLRRADLRRARRALARRARRARRPRKPKIGDTRPAPAAPPPEARGDGRAGRPAGAAGRRRAEGRRDRRGRARRARPGEGGRASRRAGERRARGPAPLGARAALASRSAATWCACTCSPHMTQIAMLEGRSLVEHYVSRAADDTNQIDGNVYRGRVQNVLPGMEAAFVDIGIPKNAVLYRGDVRYDKDDIEGGASTAAPDRGRAQGGADDPVPGHQEPDRGQGGPADPGGLAARALRRAGAQLERLRDLQAPRGQRAAPAAPRSSTR